MDTQMVKVGARVLARTASGDMLERVACSGIEQGASFPVVWVCTPEEWESATGQDRRPEAIPWPAEDVEVVTVETSKRR